MPPPTPFAAMLQAAGGVMYVEASSQAHLTSCIITSSTASAPLVRLAPADERSHAEEAAHRASPLQPTTICPRTP